MHSHLLPGIDDGAADAEMSISLINGLKDLGYVKMITTPHILWDMYQNDEHTIGNAKKVLDEVFDQRSNGVELVIAAEYFMDDHFDELLQNNTPLFCVRDKQVLVEFSFASTPLNYKQRLFDLQIKGYQPILAHPERYGYFTDKKSFDELKDAGCLFQVNLLSIAGYYGKLPMDLASYLIKKGYVDLLGTDLHHSRHLEALRNSPRMMDQVKFLLDSGKLLIPGL